MLIPSLYGPVCVFLLGYAAQERTEEETALLGPEYAKYFGKVPAIKTLEEFGETFIDLAKDTAELEVKKVKIEEQLQDKWSGLVEYMQGGAKKLKPSTTE